jgi:hypothetical protein
LYRSKDAGDQKTLDPAPAVSVLIGIPIVGEIPGPIQILGLAPATAGLLIAVGLFRRSLAASAP